MGSLAFVAARLHWLIFMVAIVGSAPSVPIARRTFALEDLVPIRRELYPQSLLVEWISDSEFVYLDPGSGLDKYNADTGSTEIFLAENDLATLNHSVVSFGKDGRFLLISSDGHKVYRYSSTARYTVYDVAKRSLHPLADGKHIQTFAWACGPRPALAYVRNNNVYYVPDVTDPLSTVALTSDGVPGEVYNGHADWIYEEEILSSAKAMWFSPQGSYLAVATFNDTQVESATYPIYGDPVTPEFQYPHLIRFKYPKAGRNNPVVSVNVYPLTVSWGEYKPIVNIPVPPLVGPDHILGSVEWATDRVVVVQWMNRRQNSSVLMQCDVVNATCEKKQIRKEPEGWIDINTMFFDETGRRMVDVSPVRTSDDRHYHAVVHNLVDDSSKDLSPGELTVRSILAWNHETDTVFYEMSPRSAPWEVQLWSASEDASECVSCELPGCRHASASFSPGANHALVLCSATFNTTRSLIYNVKSKAFKHWKNNDNLTEALSEYVLPAPQYLVAKLPSGSPAHIKLVLPPDMDPGKKYPMVLRIYGGPGSTRVTEMYELGYSTYLATNRSFVACFVDVRGSGVMGVKALHAVNRALGTVEVDDALEVIKYLVNKYSYIDGSRVGVWGWSYGGYVSALMLAHDDGKLIRCAASIAPVTSWIYYDSIYTERYMDVPGANLEGYEHSDLLLQARKLKGRKLFLVHGNADDNVHYQHSMMLSKVLQHADIEFEQMSYPDERHSLTGVSRHFYHTLDRYWSKCFE